MGEQTQHDSGGEAGDVGSMGDGAVSGEREAEGRASRGSGKRRRRAASYVESEQESEEDDEGGWD